MGVSGGMAVESGHRWSWAPVAAALLLLAGTTALFLMLRGERPGKVKRAREEVIGQSVEGRPLICYWYGDRGPVVFIKASIHGTEGAGTPLVLKLMEWLEAHPESWQDRRVVVMPVANPDGLAAGKRFNARGVDLNRNFPAGNRQDKARFGHRALTEPESRALHDFILRAEPEVIVAIHQPLNCVDYDGPPPARALAERMARSTGLPLDKLGARPGSLGAWFGETLGKPILTLELPRRLVEDPEDLWRRYGAGLVEIGK
jgi:murein peptide amidase A